MKEGNPFRRQKGDKESESRPHDWIFGPGDLGKGDGRGGIRER